MLLTLKLKLIRWWYLLRFWNKPYVVYSTPKDFRRLMLRSHNQRRERGNVQRFLGKRRGRYNATS